MGTVTSNGHRCGRRRRLWWWEEDSYVRVMRGMLEQSRDGKLTYEGFKEMYGDEGRNGVGGGEKNGEGDNTR